MGREQTQTKRSPKKKKKTRGRRLATGFAVFLVIALVVGTAFAFVRLFPAKDVKAVGSKIYTQKQIIKASTIDGNDNIFLISEGKITEKIRSKLPYIDTVSIKRELPSGITLKVTDAKEYACYNLDDGHYVVSRRGFVLNKYEECPEDTFEIICPKDSVSCEIGEEVTFLKENTKLQAEELIGILSNSGLKVDRIDISNPISLSAKVEGRFTVLFGTATDLDKKIAHLVGMCKSIEPQKTGKINLSMWTSDKTEGSFVEGEIE